MITCPTTYATFTKIFRYTKKPSLIVLKLVKSCATKWVRVISISRLSRTCSCHKALNKLCYAKVSKYPLFILPKERKRHGALKKKREKKEEKKKNVKEKIENRETTCLLSQSMSPLAIRRELLIEAHLPSSFPRHLHIAGFLF